VRPKLSPSAPPVVYGLYNKVKRRCPQPSIVSCEDTPFAREAHASELVPVGAGIDVSVYDRAPAGT